MEYRALLIKYSEIGIKGKNRYIFENQLCDRIKSKLSKLGEYSVSKEQGRVFVECPENYDYDETITELTKIFGIAGICPVVVIEDSEWDNLTQKVGDYVAERYEDRSITFKVFAKRANKQYPKESPDICVDMGEYLLERFPEMKVDVHNPELKLTVEVRNKAYVYSDVIKGPGGMPVGSNGKAMLLLSGGIDSPVAGYMIAKRGVAMEATYFHAPPYTSERAKEKVVDLARIISAYCGPIKLNIVNFTDIQLMIYEKCPHEELTIIMRRYMMRIAEELANKSGCLGLVTGESIGQVASQTMQSLMSTNAVCTLPVYRPLIGFDKIEIMDIAKKIDTYETSILPFEDCCTIFVAKHPVTKPILSIIERSEEKLKGFIEPLVEKALAEIEVVRVE